jgi:hypothetical protein
MKKADSRKIIKLSLLVILILFVSVYALSYMSKKEEAYKGHENTASETTPMGKGGTEEKTNHEGMNMEEGKAMEVPQSPKGYTAVQISPERQQLIGVKTDRVATKNSRNN